MLAAGSRLGPYEILTPLGAGGMGEVYKARDTRLDRTVAIKVLPADVANDPDLRTRFELEARVIAALDHPHICAIYDVGEAQVPAGAGSHQPSGLRSPSEQASFGQARQSAEGATAAAISHDVVRFLVMQHLEGETLAARLARTRGPLPLDEAIKVGVEIADALDKAHRAGITHRDLKPANIMLTKAGAKLLDFGLAKLRGPAAPISMSGMTRLAANTARGTILGTVHYMAPEQVEGKEADARSDIWALGATIHEMATSRKPFDGESPASVIGAILKDDPSPLSTLQPLSPPGLDHVVAVCLAKDPDERWQSAGDVKRELMWLGHGRGASPVGAGATRGRSDLGWVSAAALGVALAVTAPSAVRQWLSATPELSAVRFGVFPPENTAFTASGAAVPATQLSVSPDGTRLAVVATAVGGRDMVWIRSLDSMQARMLPGTEDAAYPFWSPDSRFVGFFTQGKLKKIDLVGGQPQTLCDAASVDFRGATWSRDGIIVFPANSASGLLQVSAGGGVPTPAIPLREGESSYRWPSFLPDGRHLLFYVRGSAERRGLYVGSLGSATMTRLLDTTTNGMYASGYLLTVRDGSLLAYPFDEKRQQITGDPLQVAEKVGGSSTQFSAFSVSAGGVLAHARALTTSSRLTWFDREGKSSGPLTEVGDYSTFRFSPDERRLAFTRIDPETGNQDVWLMEVARGVPTRFTFDPLNDMSPIWSPDGTRIVFRSDRAGGNYPFEKLSTGGEAERLLARLEVAFPSDWSPDGKYILYYSTFPATSYDVMLLPQFGDRKPIPFAQSTFIEGHGRFSPDGRWIAYESDESGRFEVYVQPFPQSGNKWRVSTSGGFEPRWRRDGKELFYLELDGTLTAVPVNATATFESGTPQRLFQTHVPFLGSVYRSDYEVVGDGHRFLVNTLVEGAGPTPITVVLNWTAGLRK